MDGANRRMVAFPRRNNRGNATIVPESRSGTIRAQPCNSARQLRQRNPATRPGMARQHSALQPGLYYICNITRIQYYTILIIILDIYCGIGGNLRNAWLRIACAARSAKNGCTTIFQPSNIVQTWILLYCKYCHSIWLFPMSGLRVLFYKFWLLISGFWIIVSEWWFVNVGLRIMVYEIWFVSSGIGILALVQMPLWLHLWTIWLHLWTIWLHYWTILFHVGLYDARIAWTWQMQGLRIGARRAAINQ